MTSKIKVDTIENVAGSGNVSLGSGHNLVVPGNNTTSGNATVGGTLGVTGTTTIGNGTSGVAKINGGSSSSGQIIFMDAGTNRARIGVPTGTTTLSLSGSNSLTGDIVIDVDGRVTKPSQPAFQIQGTCVSHTGGNETAVVYASTPTIKFNIGNHGVGGTDASTSGKFTCPVAGMYYFDCRWYRGNTGSPTRYMSTTVKKNGGSADIMYWYTNAAGTSSFGDQSIGQSGFIQCAANDVLQQYIYAYSSDSDPVTVMQIYLLG